MLETHSVRADVFHVLGSLSGFEPTGIDVTVTHDGVVFLKGLVSSEREKRIVETVVNRVVGVTEVWSVLEAPPIREEIPDAVSLMEAAVEALEATVAGRTPIREAAAENPAPSPG